ncbi:MAG TPA: S53 family peptidase [Rhodanobacteraceae bacterium]|jgi:xanthomonalisin|nr:S53 family peptidase [Rhodanobacteraceae bacterium]
MSNVHSFSRPRSLALAVAAVCGVALCGAALAAVPARGHFTQLTRATQLDRGGVVHGPLALSQPLHVSLSLKLRNAGQLHSFLAAPHGKLSHAQLSADYLPTQAQAQAVADYLTQSGFRNVKISSNRMIVSGDGTAAIAQAAFQTHIASVRTRDGRMAHANTSPIHIPEALAGSVQAVLGLQNVHVMHTYPRNVRPAARVGGIGGHAPTEFADIYGASSLAPASGVSVGVWGWGNMSQSVADLATFTGNTGLSAGTVSVVCADYDGTQGAVSTSDPTCASNDLGGTIEWNMDSQDIVGMSGGVASLTFYSAGDASNQSSVDTLNEIVNPTAGETTPQVVNASFGECERYQDANQGGDGSAQAMDALFQAAAASGITFSVSTGDSGADECGDGGLNSASYPASSPWVVAVAGTTLVASTTTWGRENLWAGSGGSPSSFEPAQDWQAPLTYGAYAGMRGPDVAFDANPASGSVFVYGGGEVQVGGTSLSAPLFAGAWARILQANPGAGFAAPVLYSLPASVFHDVRSGSNRGWSARLGWDYASGLGSFDVGAASAAIGGGDGGQQPE